MILCEFTPTGHSMMRISTEDLALSYQWYSYILAIESLKIQLPFKYGGLAIPSFTDISLSPEMFLEIGEYSDTATVKLIETDTDEAGGITLFEGTARLDTFNRYEVKYIFDPPDIPELIAESTPYNDTLINVVTAICTVIGYTLDSTLARSPSPAVLYTVTSETLATDVLSAMCGWFSHAIKLEGTTLYLIDMKTTSGTVTELTEFDVQECEYRKEQKYSLYKCGDETLAGTVGGKEEFDIGEAFHTTPANIQTALADVKLIMEMAVGYVRFKSDQYKPTILGKVTLVDESLVLPVTLAGRVINITYGYEDLSVEAEVIGSVTVI